MVRTYRYFITLLVCLAGMGAYGQNSYLLSVEHREPQRSAMVYFYLQELGAGADVGEANVVTLENGLYRIYYFRLREPSASSYFGCDKYGDEAAGEKLSLNDLLVKSELDQYDQRQQAIEAQCTALFENRGRPNSLLTIDLNGERRVKMLKVQLDVCTCHVSHDRFSMASDTLAMPRKVIQTDVFSYVEKAYWQSHVYEVLGNALVKSCLPQPDRYEQTFQVGQR